MKGIHPAIWLIGGFLYVVCPLDFDFVPVLGWVDDVAVAIVCIKKFSDEMRGPGAPGGKAIDVQHRAAPPRIQATVDLIAAKGNPNLN